MAIAAAKLQVEVGADTKAAEKGLTGFSGKLNEISKGAAKTGTALSLGVTAPLVGIATAAISSAAEFEQNLNVLQQVVGASADQMSAMQAQALELGATTAFSAGEASAAMLELGKAGMSTEQIMASISGVMDLAAAGGIGLAEAANVTSGALNAFGLEASESGRVADILAAAANASSADIADLAKGVQNAGFAFAAAGWPIEDLAASLAILTNVGLTGSDASTALKNAVMQMISPTQQAADLAKELGINFFDASGTMKSMPDIINEVNTATAGMSDQQRNAALATLFMSDGMKAMIPLLDQGVDGFNQTVGAVTEMGAASDTANARMKGFGGAVEYLKGSIDSLLIGTALPFLDDMSGIIRVVADAITKFGELPEPVKNAALAFAAVMAAAGPLMLALAGVSSALVFLASGPGLVIVAIAALAAAWTADIGGIQGITAEVFGAAQEWFKSTAAGATELARSIQTAFSNTTFPSLNELWADFQAGDFDSIANKIRDTAFDLMVNLDAELNITAKANALKQKLVDAVTGISEAVSSLDFSSAQTGFQQLRDNVQAGLSSAIEAIEVSPALAPLRTRLDEVSTQLSSAFTRLSETAGSFSLGEAITSIGTAAGNLRDSLIGQLSNAISGIDWAGGASALSGMVDSLTTAVQNIDVSNIDWADFIKSRILGPLGTAINAVQWIMDSDQFQNLSNAVKAAIASIDWGELGTAFAELGTAITTEIGAVIADAATDIAAEAVTLQQSLDQWGIDLITNVTDQINGTDWTQVSIDTSTMLDTWSADINEIDWTTVGENLATNIKNAITSFLNLFEVDESTGETLGSKLQTAVTTALTEIDWSGIGTSLLGLADALGEAGGDILEGLLSGLFADLGAEASKIEFVLPNWVTDLLDWEWPEPSDLLDWEWPSPTELVDWAWPSPAELIAWQWPSPSELLDWGWPSPSELLNWSWPTPSDLLNWDWPSLADLLNWSWPKLPSWTWPSIPTPGWLERLLSWSPSFDIPGFASGTTSAPGGLAWVGERGPELVSLPRGSRVYNHADSMAMAGGVQVTIQNVTINSDMDVHSTAVKLGREISKRIIR